ncbi:hypothetical protein LU003_11485, partial [Neisseria gonorrhoeae]|uniref:hypothetical protein n=2 Tax=Neisseria gonorrhoeae TaxID=485 RepID=UPI001F44EE90
MPLPKSVLKRGIIHLRNNQTETLQALVHFLFSHEVDDRRHIIFINRIDKVLFFRQAGFINILSIRNTHCRLVLLFDFPHLIKGHDIALDFFGV